MTQVENERATYYILNDVKKYYEKRPDMFDSSIDVYEIINASIDDYIGNFREKIYFEIFNDDDIKNILDLTID